MKIPVVISSPAIFFDQDGTLSRWRWLPVEEVKKDGYFRTVEPHENIIEASKLIMDAGVAIATYGAAWQYDGHSVSDKEWWMNHHAPHIKQRFYVPCGTPKASLFKELIGRQMTGMDILLDDCSDVLRDGWLAYGGTGVKAYDPGVNGRKGTWDGYSVSCSDSAEKIADYILSVRKEAIERMRMFA